MGLINARNLRKAKELLEKNRHKVGDIVDKAGTQLDKVSKGKTSNVTAKAADAAKKYSEGAGPSVGRQVPVDDAAFHAGAPVDPAAQQTQAKAAGVAAANAVTAAATAAANLLNNKAARSQVTQSQQTADWSPPTPGNDKVQATHRPAPPSPPSDDVPAPDSAGASDA